MSSEIKVNSIQDKTGTRVLASDSGSAWTIGSGVTGLNYKLLASASGDSDPLECTSIGSHTHLVISFKIYGDGNAPYMHFGTSGGYLADASIGWLAYENVTAKTITSGTDHGFHLTGNVNLPADNFLVGNIHVFDSGVSRPKHINWNAFGNAGGTYALYQGGGFTYASQNAFTQVKIVNTDSHSSLTDAYMYVYGIG